VWLRYLLPPELHSQSHGWELGLFDVIRLRIVLLATLHYVQPAGDSCLCW